MISPALRRMFDSPDAAFGPTPLWWWSAEHVTAERLEWQMRSLAGGGIRNLVVMNLAPAGPLFDTPTDSPKWFSEEWWSRFLQACDLAAELDVRLWFYDQLGFSGANVQGRVTLEHPSARGQRLAARRGTIHDGRFSLAGDELLVGAYEVGGQRVGAAPDGQVELIDGTPVLAVTATLTAFDYLSSTAVRLLLDRVHGEFDRRVPHLLGNVIAGSFQDELPATNMWNATFADEFRARQGYDLLDHLPALFELGGRTEAKVRTDYYQVRAAMSEESFFEPLGRWHTDRGMLVGADQSNPARAGFPIQSTQIYTDYFRSHRWLNAAGSDHEGDAKVHSSMAHLYGHDRVWIEAFHSSGWGGTLEDTWDWLLPFFRAGATLYNPHATYYSTKAGWFEWAPPSTDWRQPYWGQYPAFSKAVARVASLLSWGDYYAEVAVLHPTTTAQAELTLDLPVDHIIDHAASRATRGRPDLDRTQETYLDLVGSNNWFQTRLGALDSAGVAFDIIDDASLQNATRDGNALAVRHLRYSVAILPSARVLESGSANALLGLLECGGRVLAVGDAPEFEAGLDGEDDAVRALVSHPRFERFPDVAAAVATLDPTQQHVWSDVPLLVRLSGDAGVALVSGAYPNASAHPLRKGGSWKWEDYDFDRARYAVSRTVTVRDAVTIAELWNPATGSRQPVAVLRREDGCSDLVLDIGGAPLTLLVWSTAPSAPPSPAAEAPVAAAPSAAIPVEVTLDTGWTGHLVPTLDNLWGDLAMPVGRDLTRAQVWTVDWRERESESAQWSRAKATFGQRVLVRSPAPDASLPRPLSPTEVDGVLAGRAALGGEGWESHQFSLTRGLEHDFTGTLGAKGMVATEFVTTPQPAEGEHSVVRAIVRTQLRGPAELTVASSAERRVWWNGTEIALPDRYAASGPVVIDRDVNILEYRLGPTRTAKVAVMPDALPLGSFFTLSASGSMSARPEYMRYSGAAVRTDGSITFRASTGIVSGVRSAQLVVGAGRAASVLIDGTTVGRQELVEYYGSTAVAAPKFFSHDVTGLLGDGDHTVELRLETGEPQDVAFVDLVMDTDAGLLSLVSGEDWWCTTDGVDGRSVVAPEQWTRLEASFAAERPHPLAGAHWLRGAPALGATAEAFDVADTVEKSSQQFRLTIPAGSVEVTVPLLLSCTAEFNGVTVPIIDGRVVFPRPAPTTGYLALTTEPTAFHRGGAAWAGPAEITHRGGPIALGEWSDVGLGAWSGGVRYTRELPDGVADHTVLDLGALRGSVEVRLAGAVVGEAFCAPFRFALPAYDREVTLEITVFNTLGPFLAGSTPTSWVFPSQLSSGLFGPVVLRTVIPTGSVDHEGTADLCGDHGPHTKDVDRAQASTPLPRALPSRGR